MKPRAMLLSLLLLLLSATVLWAEDDPPGRVARLQYSSGSVSVQPGGTGDWAEAVVNRPLTAADNIWTDKNSRAELSVGTGILRMDSESSLTFTNLSDNTIQVQLHQGSLNLHLRKLYDGEIYEVDTPNMAFTVQKSGDYRFDVQPEGDTSSVIVWKGKGDATGEGPAVRVEAHERATFSNGTTLTHTFSPAPELDGFDDWAVVRDQREDHYASGAYVSADVIGARDLDDYGYWRTVPEYGAIWVPSHVAVGWAPYRYGHWVWVGPWGWTWVDDEPWGFAPFHYGRWVEYGGYWGWAPGPVYARPVYAPALVAWFGGRGWGVSVGFGGGPGYGWCPLGWGEPFVPWYHGSRNYFRQVNVNNTHITNITNITNIYNNGGVVPNRYINMRAATAVPEHALLNSQPVYRNMVRVSQNEFERAPRGTMGLAPTRTSMLGVNAGRPTAMPPQRTFARPVFSNVRTPEGSAREGTFNRGNGPASGAMPQRGGSMRAPEGATQSQREGGFGGNARNVPRPPNANAPRSGAIMGGQESVGSFPRPEGARNAVQPSSPMSPRSGALENARPEEGDRGRFSRNGEQRNIPRPPASLPNNGGGNDRNGTPQGTAAPVNPSRPGGMSNPSSRSGAMENARTEGDRGRFSRTSEEPNVPRPPANVPNNGGGNERNNAPQRTETPANSPRSGGMERSSPAPQQPAMTPRPPANEGSRQAPPSNNSGRSTDRPAPPSDNSRRPDGGGHSMYVPRPSGPVRPASNQSVDYRGWQSGRGNSARDSYQGSSRGTSESSRSYSVPRSYSEPRSYSSPRSYNSPRSSGSYGSYNPSPRSYSSSPSYSAPSGGQHSGGYQGGGSSHSGYSGGGHSNGGGHSRGRA